MNKSDSERIAAVLEKIGYQKTLDINRADLIVINMCSVRQSAVDRVFGLSEKIKELRDRKNKKLRVILTGCVLRPDAKMFKKRFDFVLNIKDLAKWPKFLNSSKTYNKKVKNYFEIQPKSSNKFSALIPVSSGCNNFCSYCVVPYTRDRLICRSHTEVINDAKKSIKNGFREIWLLGQNVNDYHSPTNPSVDFAKLLKMVDNILGVFKIFFISPHPKNFSDELIDALSRCKKFGKRLNLPVQSGDDTILKRMNRPYTINQYKKLVGKIRAGIPDINLSTDVIVGFPGETKKQFNNTVKLFKEIKFNIAYIAKYSPRSGTPAYQMKDNITIKEKKRREKILRQLF